MTLRYSAHLRDLTSGCIQDRNVFGFRIFWFKILKSEGFTDFWHSFVKSEDGVAQILHSHKATISWSWGAALHFFTIPTEISPMICILCLVLTGIWFIKPASILFFPATAHPGGSRCRELSPNKVMPDKVLMPPFPRWRVYILTWIISTSEWRGCILHYSGMLLSTWSISKHVNL